MRYIFLFFCISISSIYYNVYGKSTDTLTQTCTITGVALEYAHMNISVFQYSDYFTFTEEKIGTFNVDSIGEFSFSFPLTQTQEIFMYLGIYKCFLFAEPNSTHEIILPPLVQKTLAEELNPFYSPEDISLGVKNPQAHDLNMQIFMFNHIYESFLHEHFQIIFVLRDKRIVDVLEEKIDSVFANYSNPFFTYYKNYRLYALRHMAYQRDRMGVTKNYLLHIPPSYYNPPYMSFVQMVWKDYLTNNYMKKMGIDMRQSIIYGKSPTMFKERMEEYMALRNDTLKELILLQCLHDCFKLPAVFPRQTVLQTLDSLIILSNVPEHKTIAQAIKKKNSLLQESDVAPEFILYNQDSIPISLSKFQGKHVYIGFCRSENIECIQHYKIIEKMNKKTRKYLHVLIISYESDFEKFATFVKNNKKKYNWTFVYGADNPEIAEKYRVKGMPSYVLIDPNGDISLLHAPTPEDNFQEKFAGVYLKWRKNESERIKQEQLQRQW